MQGDGRLPCMASPRSPPPAALVALALALLLPGCLGDFAATAPGAGVAGTASDMRAAFSTALLSEAGSEQGAGDRSGAAGAGRPGPTLRPGDRDTLRFEVVNHVGRDLQGFHARVDVPEGLRVVQGDARYDGPLRVTGLRLQVVVEAVTEGEWEVAAYLTHGDFPEGGPRNVVAYLVAVE